MIFKHLPLHYRLKCKQVCQRWYILLMTRAIFHQDRHIYFSDCFIEPNRPPMSVFMNAKLPYQILSVKNTRNSPPIQDFTKETIEFWRHLGQTVTEVHFEGYVDHEKYQEYEVYKILFEMPNVQLLSAKKCLNDLQFDLSIALNEREYERARFLQLENLKTIKASHCQVYRKCMLFTETTKYLNKLRLQSPKEFPNTSEIIDTVMVFYNPSMYPLNDLKKILSILRNLTVNTLEFQTVPILKSLFALENIPAKGVKLSYPVRVSPGFDLMKSVLEKHGNIKEVSLQCQVIRVPAITQITTLIFTEHKQGADVPIRSLKFLDALVNLNSLTLQTTDVSCLFGHEAIDLPKMKKFSMKVMICFDCVNALANSFPNLSEFYGSIKDLDCSPILEKMFKNWRYLKVMEINSTNSLDNLGNSVENLEEQRLYLRTLKIKTSLVGSYNSAEDFQQLSKAFPHLNTLSISIDATIDAVEKNSSIDAQTVLASLIQGIIPAFKELTTLEITLISFPLGIHACNAVLEYLEQHGHSLRVSSLSHWLFGIAFHILFLLLQ